MYLVLPDISVLEERRGGSESSPGTGGGKTKDGLIARTGERGAKRSPRVVRLFSVARSELKYTARRQGWGREKIETYRDIRLERL